MPITEYDSSMTIPSSTEYLVGAAAEYLGLRPETVRRYSSRGTLQPARRLGNMLVFSRTELDRYRIQRKKPGNPHFVTRDPA